MHTSLELSTIFTLSPKQDDPENLTYLKQNENKLTHLHFFPTSYIKSNICTQT